MSDPWEGILDPGETVLWQGGPRAALKIEWHNPMEAVIAAFFVGFSLFWMYQASKAGGIFWMFGLIFFGIGVFNLVGVHFWRAYERQRAFYTLTDRRAFIAYDVMGKKRLDSYPITAETLFSFEDDGRTGAIYFAKAERKTRNGTTTERIGFENLEDAREVMALMRKVQRGAA